MTPSQPDLLLRDALTAPPRARSFMRPVVRALLDFLPLCAALVLCAQIGLRGLRPALAERDHLARMRVEVEERFVSDHAVLAELDRREAARHDPIFRERQRRLSARGPAWTAR